MKKLIAPLVWLALFTGCIEDYDLELDEVPPRLVVEGLITNEPGPYYIRLTESQSGKTTAYTYDSLLQTYVYVNKEILPVTDALVIVSDNAGQVDTLTLVNADDYRSGDYRLIYFNSFDRYDTVWLQQDPKEFDGTLGYYKTNSLVGVPGRTYSLKVVHRDKIYEAHTYMPPVPVIDSLGLTEKILKEEDGTTTIMPLLYFAEPQETKDYYLIQLVEEVSAREGNLAWDWWPFSVLSDEYLQPYVNGLPLNGGTNKIDYENWPVYSNGNIYVRLNSLTREAYQYYKVLTEQFENDGGIFQPSPASAPTNISSGGLGFFRASAVAVKHLIVQTYGWDSGRPYEMSTAEITEITATSAVSGVEDNFQVAASYGVCWSTEPNPTMDDFYALGAYAGSPCKMPDLIPGTKYYVRAFVKRQEGTVFYGNQCEFTTLTE